MDKFLKRSSLEKNSQESDVLTVCSCSSEEGDTVSVPVGNKRIKGLSSVWKYFTRSADKKLAKCNKCNKEYKTSGNTSNLRDHLTRMHPNLQRVEETPSTSSGTSSSRSSVRSYFHRSIEYEPTSLRKKDIDLAITKLIAVDLQPFSIVEDEAFKNLIKILDPRYTIPSKTTLRNVHVTRMYETYKAKLHRILDKTEFVAITSDCWTSAANDSYLTVTCHFVDDQFVLRNVVLSTKPLKESTNHNAKNISESLRDVFDEWKVFSKIVCIVTDSAPVMTKACEHLKKDHLPCFAHQLNLVVQDSLKLEVEDSQIKRLLHKCKSIVQFFKKSTIANEQFKKAQKTDNPLKLIQDVVTRWNSTFLMIQRILETNDAICSALLSTRKAPQPLTAEEVCLLKDILKLLGIFNHATEQICSNSVTISLIIPIVNGIYRMLHEIELKLESAAAVIFCKKLNDGVTKRLLQFEEMTTTMMGTLLDPRFKKEAFITTSVANSAALRLESEMLFHTYNTNDETQQSISENVTPLFSFLKEKTKEKQNSKTADIITLKRQYLERQNIDQQADPLEYWKMSESDYFPLKINAIKYLCVPASSVESERNFSKTGIIISDRRSRLKPKNVDKLLFLNKNQWLEKYP